MCCMFTIFGWLIDSIQRIWVFVMSCCVSSAICCLVLVACTSGIALGYNYSLAEYIDLKETNVSVFIKRGVFDDEIAEEGEMRRAGGGPAASGTGAGAGTGANLRRDSDNSDLPAKSARRLDDSIYESNNHNKYENSLSKLTAKPPRPPATTTAAFKEAAKMEELISNFPPGSLDQMKAMQAVVNARRAGLLPDVRRNEGVIQEPLTTDQYDKKIQFMNSLLSGRKFHMDQNDIVMPSNPIRDAVPRMDLAGWPQGAVPKYTQNMNFFGSNDVDYAFGHPPSFPPRPPAPSPSPIRPPTIPVTKNLQRTEDRIGLISRTTPNRETPKAVKAFKEDLDKYKQRLLFNQYDEPNLKTEDFPRRRPDEDDYEEEFKGAPVRKKRDDKIESKIQKLDNTTSDPGDGANSNHSRKTETFNADEKPLHQDDNILHAISTSNDVSAGMKNKDLSIESNREATTESMFTENFIEDTQNEKHKKHNNCEQNIKHISKKILKQMDDKKNMSKEIQFTKISQGS